MDVVLCVRFVLVLGVLSDRWMLSFLYDLYSQISVVPVTDFEQVSYSFCVQCSQFTSNVKHLYTAYCSARALKEFHFSAFLPGRWFVVCLRFVLALGLVSQVSCSFYVQFSSGPK